MFSHGRGAGVIPQCEVDGSQIPVRNAAKCLGYWWRGDMMALQSAEENIRKARKSFFHYGSLGAFQGDLSPLSTRSIMDLDSVTSRIVVRKFGFLKRQLAVGAVGVAAVAMRSLLDDPNSLCLVGECRELEEHFGTCFSDVILEGDDEVSMHEVKRVIKQVDRVSKLEKCRKRAFLIVDVMNKGGSWARLWDSALHLGTQHRWAQGPLKDAGTSRSWMKAVSSV